MFEIIVTLFSQGIKTLWEQGPIGMLVATMVVGWASAAYQFFRNKKKPKKTEPTTIDYVNDLKKLHDKYLESLNEINEKYNTTIMNLSEKRIEDMRELARDYNNLASNTLSTLDRLVEKLSSSNTNLAVTISGEEDRDEPD